MTVTDIDLIISTKNRVKELLFTIDQVLSVLGLHQNQIYIVDDGSEDDTFSAIKTRYPEIHLSRNDVSKGYIYNRNYLMNITNRAFIFSLDDDSHIRSKEDLIEAINLLFSNESYGCLSFNPYEQIEQPPLKTELTEDVIEVKSFIGCGHLIKREVFKAVGEYYEPFEFYCEEIDFCIRAFQKGYLTVLKKNLVVHHRIDWDLRHRQTEDNLSKGVYGAVWRSKLGFSNHLFFDYVHFTFPLNLFLVIKHGIYRFINFYIKKGDKKGFSQGLKRFVYMIRQNKRIVNKLSWSASLAYLRQSNF
jgi:GT2 family glycosyltransferase